jgi:hypothetical protein
MQPISSLALVRKSMLSVLGALGSGASGGVVANNLAQTNAAPIAIGALVRWDSSPFVSRTGRVLVTGSMTFSKDGGTLVAGDAVQFAIARDDATVVGGTGRAGAVAIGADVGASGSLSFIDSVTPGISHTYGIQAATAGHTGGVLTGEASIVVIDV